MKTFAFCLFALIPFFLFPDCRAEDETGLPMLNLKAGKFHERTLRVSRENPEPTPPKPFLGIGLEPVKPEDVEKGGGPKNCAGIKINKVVPASGAARADLQTGDVIFAFTENNLTRQFTPSGDKYNVLIEISTLLKDKKPGDKIEFSILRSGSRMKKTVVLGSRPIYEMGAAAHPELNPAATEPSILMRFLEKNALLDKYVKTAGTFYAASNLIQGSTHIVEGKPDFFRLKEITYLLRRPEHTSLVSEQIADSAEAAFGEKEKDLSSLISAAAGWLDEAAAGKTSALKLKGDAKDLERIVSHFKKTIKLRNHSISGLSETERRDLVKIPRMYGAGVTEQEALAAYRAAAKVDFKMLFAACAAFAQIASAENLLAIEKCALACGDKNIDKVAGVGGRVLFAAKTSIGTLIVGGDGPNVYSADAAVIIDLGGDDIYRNNAGASTETGPFSICIDLGGDDIYSTRRPASQGAGFIGAGILVDLKGDDTYHAGGFGQGCGIIGVGILADLEGDDTYRADEFSQGVGLFGIGAIAEGGGEDSYHADEFAQGLGLCKGFGAIVEVAGNDSYYLGGKRPDHRAPKRSYNSMGQGFGFGLRPAGSRIGTSGGIGLLADAKGHDRYTADYFSQGAAYWYSLGVLRDQEGCDHYFCGRYSQGAGIHLSLGALLDCSGDDSYTAYFGVSQGCGHDRAYGILEDRAGSDIYRAGWLAQGAGNDCGIGVLVDHEGDDDYIGGSKTQGWGGFQTSLNTGSVGILMDLDGSDRYLTRAPGSADGAQTSKDKANIGIFIDLKRQE